MLFMGDQFASKESHVDIDIIAKSPCIHVSNPDIEPVDPVFAAWRRLSPKTGPASEAVVANYQAGADSGG